MGQSKLNPWEVVAYPWGTAVRHRKGRFETVILNDGQEINVSVFEVILDDNGIYFL